MIYAKYPDFWTPFPFLCATSSLLFLLLWDPLSARHHMYMPPPRVAQWRGLPLPGSPLLTVTPDAPRCRRSIFYCLAPWSGLPCRPSAGPRRHSTVLSSAALRRPRRRRSVSARARRRCICLSPRTADLCSRCVKPLRLVLSEGMRVSGPLSGRRVPPLSN